MDPSDTQRTPDKPPRASKQSRMEEILKIIEEYANSQREILKALRKRFFS